MIRIGHRPTTTMAIMADEKNHRAIVFTALLPYTPLGTHHDGFAGMISQVENLLFIKKFSRIRILHKLGVFVNMLLASPDKCVPDLV